MSLVPQSHRNGLVSGSLPGNRCIDRRWRIGEFLLDVTHWAAQRTGLIRCLGQRVAHFADTGMGWDHVLFNSRGSRPSSIVHILATRL